MEENISAADANRKFSLLLRGVREGRSYVVTSHGRPVARLIPADKHEQVATGARTALLSRLEKQPVSHAAPWTRDELYEDDRRGVTVVNPFASRQHPLLIALLEDKSE